ncbi:hypothetical protein E0H73_32130 [Kribbella pittospori]|uniref:Aminoglycoside phosphotransferase family protein n=1 Tax=Kribbella pittospori TaxID=722689 RepID=A0A4R0KDD7_9ACTN|nr:hypothetical protein [Kribbella pittospori]TCC57124.1 hypothetical protein E0H73_32130 [Kribbella pittospori]
MPHNPPPARPLGPDAEGQWVRRWTSPEWTQTADAWVGRRLAERGRRISGTPVTYRARFWSVVRCYPSVEGLVWLKENNPGHRFEAGLVAALARLAPDDLIAPIAVDRERSWLLTDDQGTTLTHPDVRHQPTRRIVVRALAHLQCALLGRLNVADHPGIIGLAPSAAGDRVRAVAQEWASLQPGHPLRPEPDMLKRAELAAEVLDRRTAYLSDIVPLDLELNDVYPANIFADRSTGVLRPRFFDVGNAIWGHPFVSLHGFLDSVVEWTRAPLSRTDHDELLDVYLAAWRDHLDADPRLLRDDITATEALVGVHRLVSWLRLVPYADPIELRTRAEIPRQYLARVAELAG